ncbi:MAG: type II toxin-antitoxin system VapC family toxin [Angustibacter sp.]
MAAGLLDTNVVISLAEIPDASTPPAEPLISVITLAELSIGPLATDNELERARRLAHLQQAEADFTPLACDARVARAFAQVAASLRATGRKKTARSFDALIAATALAHGLPIHTSNPKDFSGISGLEVIEVPAGVVDDPGPKETPGTETPGRLPG